MTPSSLPNPEQLARQIQRAHAAETSAGQDEMAALAAASLADDCHDPGRASWHRQWASGYQEQIKQHAARKKALLDQLWQFLWPNLERVLGIRFYVATTGLEKDDLRQEAFLRFRKVVLRYDFDGPSQGKLESLVFTAIRNHFRDLVRDRAREVQLLAPMTDPAAPPPAPPVPHDPAERRRQIREATWMTLETLPFHLEWRLCYYLRRALSWPNNRVADAFAVSAPCVTNRCRRMQEPFRAEFARRYPELLDDFPI